MLYAAHLQRGRGAHHEEKHGSAHACPLRVLRRDGDLAFGGHRVFFVTVERRESITKLYLWNTGYEEHTFCGTS